MLRQLAVRGGAFSHQGDRRTSEEKEESLKINLSLKGPGLAGKDSNQFRQSPEPWQGQQESSVSLRVNEHHMVSDQHFSPQRDRCSLSDCGKGPSYVQMRL